MTTKSSFSIKKKRCLWRDYGFQQGLNRINEMEILRNIFNFYYRYIQPLMGLGLIVIGVLKYFYPAPELCTETFCAVSMLPRIEPFGYAIPGLFVLGMWFKDVIWNAAEGEDAPRKGRVKPEDFVK